MAIDVVFRNEKGDELTWEEMDANLANLKVAIEAKKDNFTVLPVSQGGTGNSTIEGAKTDLGIDALESEIGERLPELGNYATLDAYAGEVNNGFYVRGYANVFDGGHGIFRPTTDTPSEANGIYRQDGLGRWWKREFSGKISVKWFGATGGGIADDYDPCQSAINFASTRVAGSVVLFPLGIYRTTEGLVVDTSGVVLEGENQKGATSYSPMRFAGTMILYDANDGGPIVKIGGNTAILYSNQLRNLRLGAKAGLSVKPIGLQLNALSEFVIQGFDINGACSVGLDINACTIGEFSSYNLAANDYNVRLSVSTPTGITACSNLWFKNGNLWDAANDSVRITCNTLNVNFRDQWIEYAKNSFHVVQESDVDIGVNLILDAVVSSNGASGQPETRFFRATAYAGGTKSLRVGIKTRNCEAFNYASAYNIEYIKGTNTGPNSFLDTAEFSGGKFYGASTAVINSDTANSTAYFTSQIDARSAYASGSVIPLVAGSTKQHSMCTGFGYWDMVGSLPIRLPTLDALSYGTNGQFYFQSTRYRLAFTANNARILLPRPLVATYVDESVTVNVTDSAETLRFNTVLTANRTVTLSTSNAYNGAKFRVVRTAAATGAFAIDVGGLKSLSAAGQWCDVEHDGTAWRLTAAGSL